MPNLYKLWKTRVILLTWLEQLVHYHRDASQVTYMYYRFTYINDSYLHDQTNFIFHRHLITAVQNNMFMRSKRTIQSVWTIFDLRVPPRLHVWEISLSENQEKINFKLHRWKQCPYLFWAVKTTLESICFESQFFDLPLLSLHKTYFKPVPIHLNY